MLISDVNYKNEYSVVLTGIPQSGYLDKISVIPFVESNDSIEVLAESPVTRSVGGVALALEKDGKNPPEGILNLLSTVSFDLASGESLIDVIVFKDDAVKEPKTPTREGYMFLGWYINDNLYSFTTSVEKDIILTAKWQDVRLEETENRLKNLLNNKEFNMGTQIELPTTNNLGVTITWEVTDAIVEGKWQEVNADKQVNLTAALAIEKQEKTVFLNVTIKFIDPSLVDQLLYSYDFSDGGTSTNNRYANTNIETDISFAADNPAGPNGTTKWIANYANLNLSTVTRLGGRLTSTENGAPSANIMTNFQFTNIITKVEVLGAYKFGKISKVGRVHLQVSKDKENWTTISTASITETISFENLSTTTNTYLKLVVEVESSDDNSGLSFVELKVYGLGEAFDLKTVIFNSNNGSLVDSIEVRKGATIGLPEEPTKEGYVFLGWYTDVNLEILFDDTMAITSDLILYAKWEALPDDLIIEDFSNSNATGTYRDGSFIGINDITWTYVLSRNERGDSNNSGIDGSALMFRPAQDSKITSSVISGGISSFSVKLYKGFTGAGNRQVELFINGISHGVSEAFDDYEEHIFSIENINLEGDFTIELRNNASTQVIIDDISWTPYTQ